MSQHLDSTLGHLRALIGYNTCNPPRAIGTDGIFDYLRESLPGFQFTLQDLGDGCVNLLAVRGSPKTLCNFHIDTVPADGGWSGDPWTPRHEDDRVIGLGACDTKGTAACMLTAVNATDGDVALLFSSDEEAGQSRCVREFLKNDHGFERAIIAEPTNACAVLAHRGLAAVSVEFTGHSGHTSSGRAHDDSAVHRCARWIQRALVYAGEFDTQQSIGLRGIRFNVGRVEGGVKANMIANSCKLRFGLRPLPQQDLRVALAELHELAPDAHLRNWQVDFNGPGLPAAPAGGDGLSARREAEAFAIHLGLETGDPVDFWTEASLFSAAGLTALVYGAGSIDQAHAADEFVTIDQLGLVTESHIEMIRHGKL